MTTPLASRVTVGLDLEGGRLARPLGSRDAPDIVPDLHESRIAMRTSIGDDAMRRLDAVDRDARLAQPQRAVLGVARVVEEERRPLAALLRLRGLHLDGDERAQHLGRARADQQRGVLGAHAPEAGQDLVHLARVRAGVEQRPRVAAADVVAGDDREPPQPLRARRRRRRRQGEQREQRGLGGNATQLRLPSSDSVP